MTSLIDSFGRQHTYLRISVTERCNLRCVYCMPAAGITLRPREEILSFDEIERVARVCRGLGIRKIRLTGGEPLVRRDLPELVRRLAGIEGIETVGMTTNGVLLRVHIKELKQAGLHSVNISLDTLRRERFERIALRSHYDEVQAGIEAALEEGFAPLKLNTVVMGGVNDDELPDFVEMTRERSINVRFIEFMPFKANEWNTGKFIPFTVMREYIEKRYHLVAQDMQPAAVARDYRVPGFAGSVSFITSMSDHFCDGCNRLRLTADGSIKSCLFHHAEVNVRAPLRGGAGDDVLTEMIRCALILKPRQHPAMDDLVRMENRAMIEIGG